MNKLFSAGVTQLARVTAFQAVGRGFESRLPLGIQFGIYSFVSLLVCTRNSMFYVYILKSQKDGNLYIGQTSNLDQRLQYHNSERIKSTRKRTPLKLVYVEEYPTRGEAMRREKVLKDIKSKDFKKLLRNINSVG